jgi:dihydroneopterin aldolase
MERIVISGLELYAYHGVLEAERQAGQVFLLDLEIKADLSAACISDHLEDSINYADVIKCAAQAFCAQPYRLIERAAQVTADAVLGTFPRIEQLSLRVHKPDAPVQQVTSDIFIEIERRRDGTHDE